MGLITRLRLEFDDSHVVLRARSVLDHPATRLCKILEAIETGNDVVAQSLCEEYDVISTTRETTPTKSSLGGGGGGGSGGGGGENQTGSLAHKHDNNNNNNKSGCHHRVNLPNGNLLNHHDHSHDHEEDEEESDEERAMLVPASTVGESEARVRFRQKLCETSLSVFNYFLEGELHIPQAASFKEFQKVRHSR